MHFFAFTPAPPPPRWYSEFSHEIRGKLGGDASWQFYRLVACVKQSFFQPGPSSKEAPWSFKLHLWRTLKNLKSAVGPITCMRKLALWNPYPDPNIKSYFSLGFFENLLNHKLKKWAKRKTEIIRFSRKTLRMSMRRLSLRI